MTKQITYIGAIHYVIAATLLAATTVISDDATPIPAAEDQINSWFQANVKPFSSRKGTLDPALEAAETAPKRIKVRLDGSGDFKSVTDALKSIPSGNEHRVIVDIGAGVYTEKVIIDRIKPFVTLLGSSNPMPTLQFDGTAKKYGTVYSATLTVEADYFVAANIIIKNTAPRPDGRAGAQAVALRVAGDKTAFYNCRILGFQDTVCDDKGRHFFKDCYIEGTVDFIFGSGKSLYLKTNLNVIKEKFMTVITAQAKHTSSEDSGFSFVHSNIAGDATDAYLGRAWMEMPEVVFSYSKMSNVVIPAGWSNYNHPEREKNIFFAEYKCSGPGANPSGRAKFSKQLSDSEAKSFISLGYIQGSKWLLPPPS
ncbi:pectinesterase PPME1 [Ricinus communis]|uniref:pectinesterase PPME1 n=1 Tax=Ricinus communis TaxID=3988 RepID=UPI00201AE68F|nr:pectinesterase PPME1 [Ricinus communis]